MNDIEAAARAFVDEAGPRLPPLMPPIHPQSITALMRKHVEAIRAALAHAARGEGEERPVHRDDEWWIRRINEAHKHGGLPWLVTVAKNFPRDEGASATPPPATGMKCWRDVEGTLPARRDGDKVARVDPETAIPATGEAGTRGEVERVRAAVIDAAKAFRAHDETYLIANYENVAEEGERQRLIVKMLVAVDALLAAERSENGGDRG